MGTIKQGASLWRAVCNKLAGDEAAQIVELAVTLPLLVVILIGIYDFGQAYNLKQKLAAAAREGARFASSQSTADLTNAGAVCSPAPDSICAVRDVVDSYFIANNINDCGLSSLTTAPVTQNGTNWQWTFTAGGCPNLGNLTVTINRGFVFNIAGTPAVTAEGTRVDISYPYLWQFNRVVQLVAPGSAYGPAQIPATAVMQNLN
jgi:Flp pilus assembly protein TadG